MTMKEHHVLQIGGGIPSTTLHLMFFLAEIPQKLDCTIFPDTGAEPEPLYRHLELLHGVAGPYNYSASHANIARDIHGNNQLFAVLPAHTIDSPCAGCQFTHDFKLKVLLQQIRETLGLKASQQFPSHQVSVILYLAVTYDQRPRAELIRQRLEEFPWLKPVFPLIERKMTRRRCQHWLREYGLLPLPVPPSGCLFCPYRSNKDWKWLRKHDPAAFEHAVDIDLELRHPDYDLNPPRYLHHSCIPLHEADLDEPESPTERGLFGFDHECEGMCGL
jgi:hypothetical protein